MPIKLKWMHHNDQREINFSETYMFLLNFEIKNVQLRGSGESKCDWKNSQKTKTSKPG